MVSPCFLSHLSVRHPKLKLNQHDINLHLPSFIVESFRFQDEDDYEGDI